MSDGDGQVLVKSLRVPYLWGKMQKDPVVVKEYSNADHSGILKDETFLRDLKAIIFEGRK